MNEFLEYTLEKLAVVDNKESAERVYNAIAARYNKSSKTAPKGHHKTEALNKANELSIDAAKRAKDLHLPSGESTPFSKMDVRSELKMLRNHKKSVAASKENASKHEKKWSAYEKGRDAEFAATNRSYENKRKALKGIAVGGAIAGVTAAGAYGANKLRKYLKKRKAKKEQNDE